MQLSLDGKSLAIGLFAGVGLVAGIGAMQAEPEGRVQEVVRARQIELVNANGEARVQLFLGPDGSGNMRFRDATGNVRVKLGATNRSAAMILFDDKVEAAVEAKTDQDGTVLALRDEGKQERVFRPE